MPLNGDTPITIVGNLTNDPELRFTPSGAAVTNFRIASTPRTFNRQTQDWEDGEALFLSCAVWRQAAENAAESLQRGMRVIVTGMLKARTYETREGEKRTVFEVEVEEVGASLKFASAKVTRSGGGSNNGGGSRSSQGGGGADPWADNTSSNSTPAGSGASGGGSDPWAGRSDEPPF